MNVQSVFLLTMLSVIHMNHKGFKNTLSYHIVPALSLSAYFLCERSLFCLDLSKKIRRSEIQKQILEPLKVSGR